MGKVRARVLIIDDDEEIRSILREFLGRSHTCVATDTAENALVLLRKQRFDLIVSDIAMPGMTGLEMLPHISTLAPESVVIMVSGQRTIEFAIDAMRAGAFDYVTKPFELPEVNAVVRRALAHQRDPKRFHALKGGLCARGLELMEALTRQEFVVYYQPQIDIHSRAVVGAEALVRWQHPDFGLLAPAEFISTAEDTGMISQIGELVLREACARTRRWQEHGLTNFRVAVNASPRQLYEKSFAGTVAKVLEHTKLRPSRSSGGDGTALCKTGNQ